VSFFKNELSSCRKSNIFIPQIFIIWKKNIQFVYFCLAVILVMVIWSKSKTDGVSVECLLGMFYLSFSHKNPKNLAFFGKTDSVFTRKCVFLQSNSDKMK